MWQKPFLLTYGMLIHRTDGLLKNIAIFSSCFFAIFGPTNLQPIHLFLARTDVGRTSGHDLLNATFQTRNHRAFSSN